MRPYFQIKPHQGDAGITVYDSDLGARSRDVLATLASTLFDPGNCDSIPLSYNMQRGHIA